MSEFINLDLTVTEAIGAVFEKRVKSGGHAHGCGRFPSVQCPHPGHIRDPRVYLEDKRDEPQYVARHASGEWVCYYCQPHDVLLDAYRAVMGPPESDFGLAAICVRRWARTGESVVVCAPRCHIGSLIFIVRPDDIRIAEES